MIENQWEKDWQEKIKSQRLEFWQKNFDEVSEIFAKDFIRKFGGSPRSDCMRPQGIVIFPTETVWGLGALAKVDNSEAIRNIYNLKDRSPTQTLSVMLSDKNLIDKVASPTEKQKEILKRVFNTCPEFLGKLSLVLPYDEKKYDEKKSEWKINEQCFNAEKKSVSIRIPWHPLAKICLRAIEEHCNSPMAVTSVNISGEKNEVKNLAQAEAFVKIDTNTKHFYNYQEAYRNTPSFPIIHSLRQFCAIPDEHQIDFEFITAIKNKFGVGAWLSDKQIGITAKEFFAYLDKKWAEDERLNLGKPSTVLSLLTDPPTIKRYGVLEKFDIETMLGIKIQG